MRFKCMTQPMLALSLSLLAGVVVAQTSAISPSAVNEVLGVEDAVTMAMATSPDARRANAMLEQARGLMLGARTRLNPELGVDVANFNGKDTRKGFDGAELTYSLSQKIEIGGKRGARMATAEAEGALATLDANGIRRDVVYAVKVAYMEALAATRRRDDAKQQVAWAEKTLAATRRLYQSGGESAAQVAKGESLLEQARLVLAQAEIDTTSTQQQFAALLGKPALPQPLDKEALAVLMPLPAELASSTAPTLQRAQLEVQRAASALTQERKRALPDPTLGIGLREFRENNSQALVINLSVPLPLFDRNQGEIIKAGAALATAEAEAAKADLMFNNRLFRLQQTLSKNRQSAEMLKSKVLPAAQKALLDLGRGYEQGRNALLDVQDSARTLQEARQQLVEAQLAYQQTHAELERDLGLMPALPAQPLTISATTPVTGDKR